jgi:hypothetical protein
MKISIENARQLLEHMGYECPELDAPLETPARQLSADRWEALVGTVRIRTLGTTGFEPKPGAQDNGYRHVGFEIWSRYDFDEAFDNSHGVKRLEQYADAVRAFNLITHGQQPAC